MSTRRVVVGPSVTGRPEVSDVGVDAATLSSGNRLALLWGSDHLPVRLGPRPPAEFRPARFLPGPGGVRAFVMEFVPRQELVVPEPEQPAPPAEAGVGPAGGPGGPDLSTEITREAEGGLHATATVDLVFVLSGQISLDLGDGDRIDMVAGESAVLHGSRHRWFNRGDQVATIAVCMLGAAET